MKIVVELGLAVVVGATYWLTRKQNLEPDERIMELFERLEKHTISLLKKNKNNKLVLEGISEAIYFRGDNKDDVVWELTRWFENGDVNWMCQLQNYKNDLSIAKIIKAIKQEYNNVTIMRDYTAEERLERCYNDKYKPLEEEEVNALMKKPQLFYNDVKFTLDGKNGKVKKLRMCVCNHYLTIELSKNPSSDCLTENLDKPCKHESFLGVAKTSCNNF